MLKDATTLKLSGGNFTSVTELKLFDPHDGNKIKTVKASLLYGRNGTGKSTIARAFCKLSGKEEPLIANASLSDDSGQPLILSEDEKKHIFVFDEEYVDRNVKLQQDHLDTIVMLGEAADLTEKIERAISERDIAKVDFKQKETAYKEYCDCQNLKSPSHWKNEIDNALRGDGCWAGRDREINNGRQNTGVRDNTYKRFITLSPDKSKTELLVDYTQKIEELKRARSGEETINQRVPHLPQSYDRYDDNAIYNLLAEKIERPELSEREKKLFTLVQSGESGELSDRLIIFRSKDTHECPYCYQPLTQEYKESLAKSIEKVLSKIVDDHQKALRSLVYGEITIDLTPFQKLNGYQECVELIEKINEKINQNNEKIRRKVGNPYNPILEDQTDVASLIATLKQSLETLEQARIAYNKVAERTAPMIIELNRINSEIAYYDVIELSKKYDQQVDDDKKAKEEYDAAQGIYDSKKKTVEDLESQRRNIRLAIDTINACMKYIFFAEDRLKIIYADGVYKLQSKGQSVNPCNISVGERNILGLSYFFTSIFYGKEESSAYKETYLLIIDDPISSFDTENKIGILSFLKYELGMFLQGNKDTKALVMTHDLMTFYDVCKIFEEIVAACKDDGYPHVPAFRAIELKKNELTQFQYNKRQEYTELLKIIYDYAKTGTNEYSVFIGNIIRQVLEAFSTFEYKKGIEAVSTDQAILSLLPEPEYQSYYQNLMYRLVLHGGSHREEQIKTMKDFQFFGLISDSEKQRTAKDVLCFIYLLNKQHVIEHLKEKGNDVSAILDSWCENIKSRAVVI